MNAISSSNSRKEVKTIITNGKLILSSGILDNGYIIIENGKITDIAVSYTHLTLPTIA